MTVSKRALFLSRTLPLVAFSGVIFLLPPPLMRWLETLADQITEEIVGAALAAWTEAVEEVLAA